MYSDLNSNTAWLRSWSEYVHVDGVMVC